jgi:hypothetical protein
VSLQRKPALQDQQAAMQLLEQLGLVEHASALSAPALGRTAKPGGAGTPLILEPPLLLLDGAFCSAGCHHARRAAGRFAAHPPAAWHDGALRHPRHQRGRLSGRPHCTHAWRPHRGRLVDRAASRASRPAPRYGVQRLLRARSRIHGQGRA